MMNLMSILQLTKGTKLYNHTRQLLKETERRPMTIRNKLEDKFLDL